MFGTSDRLPSLARWGTSRVKQQLAGSPSLWSVFLFWAKALCSLSLTFKLIYPRVIFMLGAGCGFMKAKRELSWCVSVGRQGRIQRPLPVKSHLQGETLDL